MNRKLRITAITLAAAVLFFSGYAAGQNRFGQPKNNCQISLIKFNEGVSDAQSQKVIDGVKQMAAQIPGIKNIWLKVARMSSPAILTPPSSSNLWTARRRIATPNHRCMMRGASSSSKSA